MPKMYIKLFVFHLLLMFCNAVSVTNSRACAIIGKTLKGCKESGDFLYFSQSGYPAVSFNRIEYKTLKIQCHHVGIDLNKIPHVNFEEVKVIELHKCSLSNDSILTVIKNTFNIKRVEKLFIQSVVDKKYLELSETLFENFGEVDSLELSIDGDVKFKTNLFKHFQNLKTLKLHINDIIILPHDLFVPLKELETLLIRNSGEMKTETKTLNITLNSCINLVKFNLSGVKWPLQINNLLHHNRRLENVEICNNKIISLSEKVFEGASEVEQILLVNNSIQNLPVKIFATQTELTTLDISQNKIEIIEGTIFAENKDLKSINLSYNQLITISSKLFSTLEYLTHLNLEHNRITHIDFESHFGNLKSLKFLHLSHNFIQKLSGTSQLTMLTELEMDHNRLTRFFVKQLYGVSKRNLSITLMANNLETVDFRDVNVSEQLSKLTINIGKEITCNCHTITLQKFLLHKLEMNSTIYDLIEVSPHDVKCIKTEFDTPETVKNIDSNSLTCPLNFPHQMLCPKSCNCIRRPYDSVLIFRCKNISRVPFLPPYKSLKDVKLDKIQLDIAGNQVDRLPRKSRDSNYNDVTQIFASYNRIQWLVVDNIPENLFHLELRHNRLRHVPSRVQNFLLC